MMHLHPSGLHLKKQKIQKYKKNEKERDKKENTNTTRAHTPTHKALSLVVKVEGVVMVETDKMIKSLIHRLTLNFFFFLSLCTVAINLTAENEQRKCVILDWTFLSGANEVTCSLWVRTFEGTTRNVNLLMKKSNINVDDSLLAKVIISRQIINIVLGF